LNIHFHIIPPVAPASYMWSLPFGFSNQNSCIRFSSLHARYIFIFLIVQSHSKLLSGFPWPIIVKPETTK
jgi:hypothetical protein